MCRSYGPRVDIRIQAAIASLSFLGRAWILSSPLVQFVCKFNRKPQRMWQSNAPVFARNIRAVTRVEPKKVQLVFGPNSWKSSKKVKLEFQRKSEIPLTPDFIENVNSA